MEKFKVEVKVSIMQGDKTTIMNRTLMMTTEEYQEAAEGLIELGKDFDETYGDDVISETEEIDKQG